MSDCIVGKKESTESDRLALEVKLDYNRRMKTCYGDFLFAGFWGGKETSFKNVYTGRQMGHETHKHKKYGSCSCLRCTNNKCNPELNRNP